MKLIKNDRTPGETVKLVVGVFLTCVLSACGSSADNRISIGETSVPTEGAVFKVLGSDAAPVSPVAVKPAVTGEDTGDLLPVIFETETTLDLDYARASVEIIRRMNDAFILPADIDVVFADCGIANAFYVPVRDLPPPDMPDDMERFDELVTSAGGAVSVSYTHLTLPTKA